MFGRARPAATPQTAPPPPPAQSGAVAPPPPPPPPPAAEPSVYVAQNGQAVLMAASQARALPANTPAMRQGDNSWSSVGAIFPTVPAPATPPPPPPAAGAANPPASRGAFGRAAATPAAPAAPAPSGVPARNLFSGVEGAEVIRRGSYVEPGDYVARLLEASYKPGRNGNYVIFEMEIVESSYEANHPDKGGCNKPGDKVSVFVKQNDNFASNIKEAVIALSGFNEQGEPRPVDDTVTQEECNALISAEQPFRGALVYLEAREKPTRAGGNFTRISWWPCPVNADGSPDLERLQAEIR